MDAVNMTHADTVNPWDAEDKTMIALRNALRLGERTGHIAKRADYETDFDENELEHLPSVKLINILKQMSHARAELNKINLEIQLRMLDKETGDVTHLDILEQRIGKIKSLNSHIESIIESKDQLIQRLQQPFQGDYLKLEAQYHRFASELFPQVTLLLANLTSNLENIVWAKSFTLSDGRIDAIISDMCSVVSAMQTSFQSYFQIHSSMAQLHSLQTGALHSTQLPGHDSFTEEL